VEAEPASFPVGATGHIVVGIDGSEPSKAALRWAMFMAQALRARVYAVAVWQIPAGWANAGWTTMPIAWDAGGNMKAILDNTIREVLGEQHSGDVTPVVSQGGPAPVLLSASENGQLLVVG